MNWTDYLTVLIYDLKDLIKVLMTVTIVDGYLLNVAIFLVIIVNLKCEIQIRLLKSRLKKLEDKGE